ncbi:hypothetical protein LSAT2_004543 [Lamellibrachia satsuma]|nr:hypothetical protein LSAT2_004543 [Lamellibrachia satsuma]
MILDGLVTNVQATSESHLLRYCRYVLPFVRLSVDGQPVDEVGCRPVRARPLLASGADTRQPVAVLFGTNRPVNIALGRPTFQSSVRTGRGASLAVDGNKSPESGNVGSCSAMDIATRAWWTVDLGAVVNVKEVAISQRDQYVVELSNFIVAATNVTPSDTSPSQLSPSDYDVCATRVDPIPLSTTMTFRCESTDVFGRYVFVLRRQTRIEH